MAPLHSEGASGTATDPIADVDEYPTLETELDKEDDLSPLPELTTA